MTGTHPGRRRQRGTILVQVAISLLAITAFSAFVIDYGMMWVARGQAQAAADLAAHAGAVALAFDSDPAATLATNQSTARDAVAALSPENGVGSSASSGNSGGGGGGGWGGGGGGWGGGGGGGGNSQDWSVVASFGNGTRCAGNNDCVTAHVYRNGTNSSTVLPVLFGGLLGATGLGVQAEATASFLRVTSANCVLPIALPDKFTDNVGNSGNTATYYSSHWPGYNSNTLVDGCGSQGSNQDSIPWGPCSTYDKYCNISSGCQVYKTSNSHYTVPYAPNDAAHHGSFAYYAGVNGNANATLDTYAGLGSDGFSWTNGVDYGSDIDILGSADLRSSTTQPQPAAGQYLPLAFPGNNSQNAFNAGFSSCNSGTVNIGDGVAMATFSAGGGGGWGGGWGSSSFDSLVSNAINSLNSSDRHAYWNSSSGSNGNGGWGGGWGGGGGTSVTGVVNSCADSSSPCAAARNGQSPRIVILPLYDPQVFEDCRVTNTNCPANTTTQAGNSAVPRVGIKITNFVGCFATPDPDSYNNNYGHHYHYGGHDYHGEHDFYGNTNGLFTCTFMAARGVINNTANPTNTNPASFLRAMRVTR